MPVPVTLTFFSSSCSTFNRLSLLKLAFFVEVFYMTTSGASKQNTDLAAVDSFKKSDKSNPSS